MRRLWGWIVGFFATRPRPDVVEQDHPNRRRRRVFLVRNVLGLMEAITKAGVPQEGDPHPDNDNVTVRTVSASTTDAEGELWEVTVEYE
jgi:hypothetical protein